MLREIYVIRAVGCLTRRHAAGFQYLRSVIVKYVTLRRRISLVGGCAASRRDPRCVDGSMPPAESPLSPIRQADRGDEAKENPNECRTTYPRGYAAHAGSKHPLISWRNHPARVVELADTADSKSVAFQERAGSSPAPGTITEKSGREPIFGG